MTQRNYISPVLSLFLMMITANGFAKDLTNQTLMGKKDAPIRATNWAQPFFVPGVKNCYQVSSNFFRGAQPTAEGIKNLKAAGIKTVVNLRTFHSDRNKIAKTGLKSAHLYTKTWHGEKEDVIAFLQLFADTNSLPIFVHCQRGSDRTGMMCAMYRLAICGWTKEQAVAEMKDGGFNFYPGWKNLGKLIENMDVADLKRRAGPDAQ